MKMTNKSTKSVTDKTIRLQIIYMKKQDWHYITHEDWYTIKENNQRTYKNNYPQNYSLTNYILKKKQDLALNNPQSLIDHLTRSELNQSAYLKHISCTCSPYAHASMTGAKFSFQQNKTSFHRRFNDILYVLGAV